MASPGQVIRNPATGETVTFLTTRRESGGALLELELEADRAAVARHVHPRLREHWSLREGTVRFRVGDEDRVLEAPAELELPPGTPHGFEADGPLRAVVRYEPAGRFEDMLETVYALAAEGKTNAKGMPNALRAAVIARAHLDDYALPFPPLRVQRVLFALLAPLGRALGYRPHYP